MNPYRLSVYMAFGLLALTACGSEPPTPALIRDVTGSCSRTSGCSHFTYILMGDPIECNTPIPSATVVLQIARWGAADPTYGDHKQAFAVDMSGTFKVGDTPYSAVITENSTSAVEGSVKVSSVKVEQGGKWMVGKYEATLPDGRHISGEFDGSPCP